MGASSVPDQGQPAALCSLRILHRLGSFWELAGREWKTGADQSPAKDADRGLHKILLGDPAVADTPPI